MALNPEQHRLDEDKLAIRKWKRWGAYLGDRQWGTVREDYSADGSAWTYLPHDHARSRAYRWGEDGLAGFSDHRQRLCLSLGLWNGRDPILKERLFGLTGIEGNHGEDVKELYYHLDATPTHSYLKTLYKYPHAAFPYARLVEENKRRGRGDPEYEILDTGVFDHDRYFDVFVEYAKASPEDILMRITAFNRGPEAATLHLVPQLVFRNTWSWTTDPRRPVIAEIGPATLEIRHPTLGEYQLFADGDPEVLFCDNDTNMPRIFGSPRRPGWFKDGINDYIVNADKDAVSPDKTGTKAAFRQMHSIAPGGKATMQLRLTRTTEKTGRPFTRFADVLDKRIKEADAFYSVVQGDIASPDARRVQRQALAGMIWSQQYYGYDVRQWLQGDNAQPRPPRERLTGRNSEWAHLNNAEILSLPDKWEYPWYAAWDLAFHCIPLALVDPEFAKGQLVLLTREWYMHPNGQLPAYEWGFGDVNPPVHAWATWRVFEIDRERQSKLAGKPVPGDREFLERVFHKLLLNFTWWVNRKDLQGRNVFQGGFLGLDNIGVFDRSAPLPTGGHLNQADGTSWVAMYCLNLMRIALELSRDNSIYQDLATKFFEHFLFIAGAMTNIGATECNEGISLWSQEDEFYYDVLCRPDGSSEALKVRSIVGLIPLLAVEVLDPELLARVPEFDERLKWFLNYRPDLANLVSRFTEPGRGESKLLSLLRGHRMKCLLRRALDETEFLSDYGVRSLSKFHEKNPYVYRTETHESIVHYEPGESNTGMFGGNSNWRGPIWIPLNFLLIESLRKFHVYYGDDFKIECPSRSGRFLTLCGVADELSTRLNRIFLREDGRRPVFNGTDKMQDDPHFRDYLLFYEYFHGETGRGVGASHQTGWTGLIATLLANGNK